MIISGRVIQLLYLFSAVLFMLGLKRLSSPETAREGNLVSIAGMAIAVGLALLTQGLISYKLIILGMAVGAVVGIISAVKVRMTAMPEMVAMFNGCGGAASMLVAVSEYHRNLPGSGDFTLIAMFLSVIVGGVTFTGSLIAFGKLNGTIGSRPVVFSGQQALNAAVFILTLVLSALVYYNPSSVFAFWSIVLASLALGAMAVIPIGGADMPVIISLLNSYSGLAVSMTGFVLRNYSLIVVGALVGASGFILTRIMCEAMNRSLANVLFGTFGAIKAEEAGPAAKGVVRSYTAEDAATVLDNSSSVIIVPGYGMAASRAQIEVREIADILEKKGVSVKYAIHPVAGRMPGHMNVLLADADVPYDRLFSMEEINEEFARTDAAFVIGANDVVNPAARTDTKSPIYGMPILNADQAKTVIVLKRSMGPGFSGIENELFIKENTIMVFGDAKETLRKMINRLKES